MSDCTPGSPQQAGAEIENRCGNCRWLDIATGHQHGICNAPLPFWVWDMEVMDDLVSVDMGESCETWRKRGAE